ncbi:hypothetical protein PHMEG_00041871 [Phytophthora megakarya]|uniref:Uncharacterized protein n=1 Tax=Phytophthora megakarya TaxID=4795 RepID=A0A225UBY7_9STRA|nr:hypothetical protein PHMEG_00041871 [Phytophthora megakarya]
MTNGGRVIIRREESGGPVFVSECKLTTSSKRPKAWRVFLCDKPRHGCNDIPITCFDLWHKKRRIRACTPARECGDLAVESENVVSCEDSNEGNESGAESTTGGPHMPKRARVAEATD